MECRSPRWMVPTLVVFVITLSTGCSEDSAGPEPVDVDQYLGGLPAWSEMSPPLADNDYEGDPTASIDWDQQMLCTTTPCSITRTPEDIVTYSPNSETLYLGSLIQGKTYVGGLGTMQELPIRQRAPLTVTIDLHTPNSSRVVENPSLATVMDAIHDLVAEASDAGYQAGSSIYFSQIEAHSLEQSTLALGMSAKYMGASVKASLRADMSSETSTLTAYFVQRMFTTSCELPQTPGAFFSDEFTTEQLQTQIDMGRLGPDNLPVFVSNIVWGRMMTLTMTSSQDVAAMKAALSASYSGINGTVDAEHLQVLQSSTIKLVTIGGDAEAALNYLRTGQLGAFFAEDAPLTTAVPLSYTVRNLGDNSIASVSETTSYDLVECAPLTVTLLPDEPRWRQTVLQAGMSIEEFYLTAENVMLANEVDYPLTVNTGLPPKLTFDAAVTGFLHDHSIEANDSPQMTWNDDEIPGRWRDSISIGDADNWENDDFDITVTGSDVYGVSFVIGSNTIVPEEYLQVWAAEGAGEQFLHQFSDQELSPFIGIVSPVPIRRVHFNEDAGGDDIWIANLFFATR